jgi:hypothetical protein
VLVVASLNACRRASHSRWRALRAQCLSALARHRRIVTPINRSRRQKRAPPAVRRPSTTFIARSETTPHVTVFARRARCSLRATGRSRRRGSGARGGRRSWRDAICLSAQRRKSSYVHTVHVRLLRQLSTRVKVNAETLRVLMVLVRRLSPPVASCSFQTSIAVLIVGGRTVSSGRGVRLLGDMRAPLVLQRVAFRGESLDIGSL